VDDHDVTREIELEADAAAVWEALADPEQLSEWLGGDVDVDVRPGGDLTVREDGGTREGFVEDVEPERRLSFWWSRDEEDATRVEIELEEAEAGTLVRVTESRPLKHVELELAELTRQTGGGPICRCGAPPINDRRARLPRLALAHA
jgi:uncharacterized protein YndB with AHSA1/START domain